jgi:hypothetical protein
MNYKNLIRHFVVVIFVFGALLCKAQPNVNTIDNYLFQRTNIIFSVTPTYTFKGKSTLVFGDQNMTTQNLMSAEAGLGLVFNVWDELGVKTGFQVGAFPYDWGYDLNSSYDTLLGASADFYSNDFSAFDRDYFGYINIPLQVENRKRINTSKYFLCAAGVNLKWTFSQVTNFGYSAAVNDTTSVDILRVRSIPAEKHLSVPLSLSAGIGFVLKNKNMLVLNVKSEIGFTDLITGEFVFFPGQTYKSVGTYAKKGSYIGLEVGYRLTKGREMKSLSSPAADAYIRNKGHINHKIDTADISKIFSRNQLEFNLGYQFNLKPQIEPITGNKADISTSPDLQMGIAYIFNKNKNWGIKAGSTFSSYNYSYDNLTIYSASSSQPNYISINQGKFLFTMYSSYEYRYSLAKSIMLYGDAGLAIGMFGEGAVNYSYRYNSNLPSAAQNYIAGQSFNKVLFGTNLGLGLLFATKNYNMWRIGATWFNSFTTGATETYSLNNGYPNQQTGTTNIKGSNVAINVGYVYSFAPSPYAYAKRKLRLETAEQFPKARITANDLDTLYSKNQMAITGQLNFMIRPKVTATTGITPYVNTYGTLGLAADYLFNFNKHWSVITGISIGRYNYDADGFSFNAADSTGYSLFYDNYITTLGLNAAVEYRIPLGRKNLWYNDLGISANATFTDSYSYINQFNPFLNSTASNDDSENGFNAGAKIETGILLTFRNYSQLKFGIKYYQTFSPLMVQNYSITNAASQTLASGKITASGSYIGLNAAYVFSFKKHHRN